MSDLLTATKYIDSVNLTFEFRYRLNFAEEKSCGYTKVYRGKLDEEDENYELYMEMYECGLTEEEAVSRFNQLMNDAEQGKLDLDL